MSIALDFIDQKMLQLELDETIREIEQAEDIIATRLGIDVDEASDRLYAFARLRLLAPKLVAKTVVNGTLSLGIFGHLPERV